MTFHLDTFGGWIDGINTAIEERRQCEVCGKIYDCSNDINIHFPHDEDCENQEGCQCDHVVCPGCCWECNEK